MIEETIVSDAWRFQITKKKTIHSKTSERMNMEQQILYCISVLNYLILMKIENRRRQTKEALKMNEQSSEEIYCVFLSLIIGN